MAILDKLGRLATDYRFIDGDAVGGFQYLPDVIDTINLRDIGSGSPLEFQIQFTETPVSSGGAAFQFLVMMVNSATPNVGPVDSSILCATAIWGSTLHFGATMPRTGNLWRHALSPGPMGDSSPGSLKFPPGQFLAYPRRYIAVAYLNVTKYILNAVGAGGAVNMTAGKVTVDFGLPTGSHGHVYPAGFAVT